MKTIIKKIFIIGILVCCSTLIFSIGVNKRVYKNSNAFIFSDIKDLPKKTQTVLILGAGVQEDGTIGQIYQERIDTAINVYKAGKAENILVSADNSTIDYDEVRPVANYLVAQGIPIEDIFLDFAGFDTYDSVYRAKKIFNVESLIICSQGFHIPRAIYLAKKIGLDAYGIQADKNKRNNSLYQTREYLANIKAWLNITFQSKSKFEGKEIPITGTGNAKDFVK